MHEHERWGYSGWGPSNPRHIIEEGGRCPCGAAIQELVDAKDSLRDALELSCICIYIYIVHIYIYIYMQAQ